MKTPQLIKTFGFLALFIFFYGCTTEEITNIYNNNEGLGKVNIYIEGNITNAEAQAKLEAQIGTQTENIYVRNTTQLTEITINLGMSENFRDVIVEENPTLGNLTITGASHKINDIKIMNNIILTNILLDGVTEANNLSLFYQSSTSTNPMIFVCNDLIILHRNLNIFGSNNENNHVTFNHLKVINYTHKTSYFSTENSFIFLANQLDMPSLEEVHDLAISIEILNLTVFKKANVFSISTKNIELPILHTCWSFFIGGISSVQTTLALPNLINCYKFDAVNTNFTSNQVNQLLNQFLNILPASKQIYIYGNNAPPTGQGLIDKQTLINQGNTVLTN